MFYYGSTNMDIYCTSGYAFIIVETEALIIFKLNILDHGSSFF